MDNPKIPDNYQTVMPYILVDGAARFSTFLQEIFQGIEQERHMRDGDIIMHASVKIGDSTIMFADATEQWRVFPASLFIFVADVDRTYQQALDAGCTSIMPLSDQDYGRTCGIKDPFGNIWWPTTVL